MIYYIHGWKYVARTDHEAHNYLRNFADEIGRLRWSIKLTELDFVVEHRAGKMVHVDPIAFMLAQLVQGGNLEKEYVLREEAKDAFCLSPGTYVSRKYFLTTMVYIDVGRRESVR